VLSDDGDCDGQLEGLVFVNGDVPETSCGDHELDPSARLDGRDSYAYLKDLLTRLSTRRAGENEVLLPHRWRQGNQDILAFSISYGVPGTDSTWRQTHRPFESTAKRGQ